MASVHHLLPFVLFLSIIVEETHQITDAEAAQQLTFDDLYKYIEKEDAKAEVKPNKSVKGYKPYQHPYCADRKRCLDMGYHTCVSTDYVLYPFFSIKKFTQKFNEYTYTNPYTHI